MQTFVYIEPSEEGIEAITRQIASRIRGMSPDLRGPVRGISLGTSLEGMAWKLSNLFDELMAVEVPTEHHQNTEVISNVLTDIVGGDGPALLFLGFTHQGMEIAPAVGWRLKVPVMTSCTGFDLDDEGRALVKRPILGGKISVSSVLDLSRGAVVSIQKGAWKEQTEEGTSGDRVPVTRLSWKDSWTPVKSKIIQVIEDVSEDEEDITKAEILVSVGRGLGDPDHLPLMRELAEKLNGVLSCSRPVVDLRWLPASRQVGISGKTVNPVVYLALGISGQTNHVVGMDASGIIIAVNRDPLAPIFNVAHYGVQDDLLEFVPELIRTAQAKTGEH